MHPRTHNYLSRKTLKVCEVVLVFIFSSFSVFAANDNIVIRENVSKSNREELLRRLRTITGWTDLAFDTHGVLRIGNADPRNGSKSARELLNRSLSANRIILFEDASSRKDVVFCSVLEITTSYGSSEVYVVRIDFADFRRVSGDKQALAAFDVGWAVLHEIDHVTEDSQDPQQNVPGNCEGRINRMRRELGLPVRNSYFFSFLPVKSDGILISRFVRLGFDQESVIPSKTRRYWLVWDAAVVGGLPSETESARASARASLDIF
jgi:hypothetical protein